MLSYKKVSNEDPLRAILDFPGLSNRCSFFAWILGEFVKNISLYLYVLLSSVSEILWRKKSF